LRTLQINLTIGQNLEAQKYKYFSSYKLIVIKNKN
jgi:hypothetical protein